MLRLRFLSNARSIIWQRPRNYRVCQMRFAANDSLCNREDSRDGKKGAAKKEPPPPMDDSWIYGTLAAFMVAGGIAIYAKSNTEFRDWLSLYAPWFDDVVAFLYEENETYKEFLTSRFENFTKYANKTMEDNKPKPCSIETEQSALAKKKERKVEKDKHRIKPECKKFSADIFSDMDQVGKYIDETGKSGVDSYLEARDACMEYIKLVETSLSKYFTVSVMRDIEKGISDRKAIVAPALQNSKESTAKLTDLSRCLACGLQIPKEELDRAHANIHTKLQNLKEAETEYIWENQRVVALDSLYAKLDVIIRKYTSEVEGMYRGAKYDDELKMPVDPELLTYQTYKYRVKLMNEISRAADAFRERINRGILKTFPNEKKRKEVEKTIDSSARSKLSQVDKDVTKRLADLKTELANDLKETLSKQAEANKEEIETKVAEKEREMMAVFDENVAELVNAQKEIFRGQTDEMKAKIKDVEDEIERRCKAAKESNRARDLYAAAQALLQATKKAGCKVSVGEELKRIEKVAGDEDKLVKTLLEAIPKCVWENGIVPESTLQNKYQTMEKTAMKVALVGQEGSWLPVYMISWLQSLMFVQLTTIPNKEINKHCPSAMNSMDTFDLLQRARYYIARGDLASALRYVSSLKGAPNSVATPWRKYTSQHLEVRQAAETIMSHAMAITIQYL